MLRNRYIELDGRMSHKHTSHSVIRMIITLLENTRALDRRGHSLSQHTQYLKNNMIDENGFFYETLIQSIRPTRSHLARFARARFALRAHENFRKKSVSQSTRNALKRIEMPKKFFTPLTDYALRA